MQSFHLISLFQNVQLETGTMPTQKQQLRSPSYRRVRRSESSRVLAGRKVLALATPRRLARLDIRHFVCKVSSCDSLLPSRPCFANAKGGGCSASWVIWPAGRLPLALLRLLLRSGGPFVARTSSFTVPVQDTSQWPMRPPTPAKAAQR